MPHRFPAAARYNEGMSQIRVVARVIAKSGQETALREVLRGMLAPTHAEPGCIFYELYQSDDPARFYFYELWESMAALDRHVETPHFQNLVAVLPDLVAEPLEVNLVEAVPV